VRFDFECNILTNNAADADVFPSAGQTHWRTHEALVPDLAEEQHAFCLCGIEQALEQHEQLARLRVTSVVIRLAEVNLLVGASKAR
jgi:hypothetical protein